jgi:3'(2'), 5'-bisphosphate nucleotidase
VTDLTSAPARVHELAKSLATEAGEVLVELRARLDDPGCDVAALRAEADRRANAFLLDGLRRADPGTPILSEEAPDERARLELGRAWIVDPLDGTREYGEPGRTDWAVHVAYVEEASVRAAAVALPAVGKTLSTARFCAFNPFAFAGNRSSRSGR